ncbi:MAG: sugar-binding domain-containing protein, partial [Pseudomonadota bacterium]
MTPNSPLSLLARTPLRTKLSLDGIWEFRHESQTDWHTARVPGHWQAQFPELAVAFGQATYTRDIAIPAGWTGREVSICFGAVSDSAVVRLDGQEIARHEGGYLPFDVVIPADLIRASNRLEVQCDLP